MIWLEFSNDKIPRVLTDQLTNKPSNDPHE